MPMTYKYCRFSCTLLLVIISATFSNHALADDIFVGKFASLADKLVTTEDSLIEIYIVPKGDQYIVSVFYKGRFEYDYLGKRCDPNKYGAMPLLAEGEAYGLCNAGSGFVNFVYSQNGINADARLKNDNGENLYKESYLREQYFKPAFSAFRRVDSFKYAPNDPIKLLIHETSEFSALCKDAGMKLMNKPAAPVRSIAYDFDPKLISGWWGATLEIALDEDGRILGSASLIKPYHQYNNKKNSFEFTERRRGDGAGAATINPTAPYYHFPAFSAHKPYYGVNEISADVLAFLDVGNPEEYKKAPIGQGAIRYRVTLTDRRSGATLGTQVFVVDNLNHRACGANADNVISPSAFIFDAINR